ncbi:hypothetical protein [Candidatus Symbiobacter mobilis]|uniref:Uncharacterized protein n=1 Tax=Candidatus Symbiobacter mobilis CR TaxID=946483 RepID=U5N8R3_9BURK|nr:hypothetical protein [Candidatus Symbiobacter mobilis]AGX86574.1 hypothetical protein Cenrod_0457 [Candidatus Symbiobacter mobilis CR]
MSLAFDWHPLHRLWLALSLRAWLLLAGGSSVLALLSGLYLAVLAGLPLPHPWAQWFDQTELFIRDTIRLTFRDRRPRQQGRADYVVTTAPVGILEPAYDFQWLTPAEVDRIHSMVSDSLTSSQKLPGAPASVLDPSWNPVRP